MKKTIAAFFFLVLMVVGFDLSASTTPQITATIVFTNNPSVGNTISINGVTQIWTNNTPASVFYDVIQGQQTNSAGYLYTNTINNNLLAGIAEQVTYDGSNTITIVGARGLTPLTIAFTGTWATNGLSTNLYQDRYTVVVPATALGNPFPITNIDTILTGDMGSNSQAPFATQTILMTNFMDLSTAQTNIGAKTMVNPANVYSGGTESNILEVGNKTNQGGFYLGGTNSIFFGNEQVLSAFGVNNFFGGVSSGNFFLTGTGNSGVGAGALNALTAGVGNSAVGASAAVENTTGSNNSYLGNFSGFDNTTGNGNTGVGAGALLFSGTGGTNIALGFQAGQNVNGSYDIDIGNAGGAESGIIRLGTPGIHTDAYISGSMHGAGNLTITNAILGTNTYTGVNTWTGDVAYTPLSISSLANGNNADMAVGSSIYCRLSGPTGAFAIVGIAGGRDGRILTLQYSGGQTWTILNNSGVDSTAANRILTGTGATITMTNIPSFVQLIYDGNANLWGVLQALKLRCAMKFKPKRKRKPWRPRKMPSSLHSEWLKMVRAGTAYDMPIAIRHRD